MSTINWKKNKNENWKLYVKDKKEPYTIFFKLDPDFHKAKF